jgi:hypothetical protein
MDEKKLAELLKDAVTDTPPPTFTHSDVTAESERQRVRHRNGVLAGSAFGVAALAGATALGVALWIGPGLTQQTTSADSAASGGNGNAAPYELPDEGGKAAAPTERGGEQDFPPEAPKQGGSPDGNGGTAGPASTPSGCEQVDRELAAALAGELPVSANVKVADARPVSLTCVSSGVRAAAFDLSDGGSISVLLIPADALSAQRASRPSSGAQVDVPTDSGRHVLLVSEPATSGGSVPYESDLRQFARDIAKLY